MIAGKYVPFFTETPGERMTVFLSYLIEVFRKWNQQPHSITPSAWTSSIQATYKSYNFIISLLMILESRANQDDRGRPTSRQQLASDRSWGNLSGE